jgi:GT2 family glycosyltransferase
MPTLNELTGQDRVGYTQAKSPAPEVERFPSVSIVIPVLNDADGLNRCLLSICSNDYPRELVEIIVVDNGSSDGSPDVARRHGAIVLTLAGRSVATMRNVAAAQARGSLLAFVDADHTVERSWLRIATAWLRDPTIGAVGAPYISPQHVTWVQRMGHGLREHRRSAGATSWLPSGNLVVTRRAFLETRGFDVSLTTCEDVDFCRRLRQHGFRLVNEPAMRSVHYGDAATIPQLFKGELWRGRDNLRVSMRERLTLRSAPGVLFPLVYLAALALLPIAAATVPLFGIRPLVALALALVSLIVLRTCLTLWRVGLESFIDLWRGLSFAVAYESARALALVTRTGHRRAPVAQDRCRFRGC